MFADLYDGTRESASGMTGPTLVAPRQVLPLPAGPMVGAVTPVSRVCGPATTGPNAHYRLQPGPSLITRIMAILHKSEFVGANPKDSLGTP